MQPSEPFKPAGATPRRSRRQTAHGAPARPDTLGWRTVDVRRASSAVARFPGLIAVPALWVALRIAYGPGYAHYDALYELIWGAT